MKKFIQVTLNTGHVYEIPTGAIVENRAAYYHANKPEEFPTLDDAKDDTVGLFDDATQIADWAANNMNWDELAPNAKLIRFKPPVEQAFHEADWSFHDAQALMGELDGETIMKQPVELVMHTMAMTGQLCNVTILNGPDGAPYGAFAMIIGNQPVVNSYINALQIVGNMLTGSPENAQEAATH